RAAPESDRRCEAGGRAAFERIREHVSWATRSIAAQCGHRGPGDPPKEAPAIGEDSSRPWDLAPWGGRARCAQHRPAAGGVHSEFIFEARPVLPRRGEARLLLPAARTLSHGSWGPPSCREPTRKIAMPSKPPTRPLGGRVAAPRYWGTFFSQASYESKPKGRPRKFSTSFAAGAEPPGV